jgi:hypothetical protein
MFDNADVRVSFRFHGEKQIREGGRYKMSMVEDAKLYHMVKLAIIGVNASDSGEYRAVAKNKLGEGVATIALNFDAGSDKPKYDHDD